MSHPIEHRVVVVALIVAVVSAFAFARRTKRSGRVVAIAASVIFLAMALPGLHALAFRRADRPTERARTAQVANGFATELTTYAAASGGCVSIDDEGCSECIPVARYAIPDPSRCHAPRGRVVLRRDGLALGCHREGSELVCGRSGAP